MPRFSVVIPAYNAVRTIGLTIASVLAQTESDLELIVVDDGSADHTPALVAALARDDPRITLVEQPNAGTAGARNTGASHAVAEYVSFVDNDDLWMPRYLECMGAALDSQPGAGFAYCDGWILDDARRMLRRKTELQARPDPPRDSTPAEAVELLAHHNWVVSSATVRRQALEDAGGFATTVLGSDDYDLWFRLLLAGFGAVRAAPEPLMLQRDRHDSQSKDRRHMGEGLRRVLTRAAADPRMPDPAREICETRMRAAEVELASGPRSAASRALGELLVRAVAVRDRLAEGRIFYETPPPEVAAAFPELAARGSRTA